MSFPTIVLSLSALPKQGDYWKMHAQSHLRVSQSESWASVPSLWASKWWMSDSVFTCFPLFSSLAGRCHSRHSGAKRNPVPDHCLRLVPLRVSSSRHPTSPSPWCTRWKKAFRQECSLARLIHGVWHCVGVRQNTEKSVVSDVTKKCEIYIYKKMHEFLLVACRFVQPHWDHVFATLSGSD